MLDKKSRQACQLLVNFVARTDIDLRVELVEETSNSLPARGYFIAEVAIAREENDANIDELPSFRIRKEAQNRVVTENLHSWPQNRSSLYRRKTLSLCSRVGSVSSISS